MIPGAYPDKKQKKRGALQENTGFFRKNAGKISDLDYF